MANDGSVVTKTGKAARRRGVGRLALTVAAGALGFGYGRGVQAGDCTALGAGTYRCAGAGRGGGDATQVFADPGLNSVTIAPDFGLDTTNTPGAYGFFAPGVGSLDFDGREGTYVRSDGTAFRVVDDRSGDGSDIAIDTSGLELESRSGSGIGIGSYYFETIDITAGPIEAGGFAAIAVHGSYEREVSLRTTAPVTGAASGIYAIVPYVGSPDPAVTIDTTAGAVTAGNGPGVVGAVAPDESVFSDSGVRITTADVASHARLEPSPSGSSVIERCAAAVCGQTYGSSIIIDTTAGTITATSPDVGGILAGGANAAEISVTTGVIDTVGTGVRVSSDEDGPVFIDTRGGRVTSSGGAGISVSDEPDGVTIHTADVAAARTGVGVNLSFLSSGDVFIDTTAGAVTSTEGVGISSSVCCGYYGSQDTQINTGDISGDTGIYATALNQSLGPIGTVTIDTTRGTVTGRSGRGIAVRADYGGHSITTADVVSSSTAIEITVEEEGGNIDIDTTAGALLSDGVGIEVNVEEAYGPTTVRLGDITAANQGFLQDGRMDAEITVLGDVTGSVAIDTNDENDPTNESVTTLTVAGSLTGTSGIAFDLGAGADRVTITDPLEPLLASALFAPSPLDALMEPPSVIGLALLGPGDDVLEFASTGPVSVLYTGDFADVFDGGAGEDQVIFDVPLSDVVASGIGGGGIVTIGLAQGAFSTTLRFRGFETFAFEDGILPNPVIPLPASLLFLATALAGLGLRRRARGGGDIPWTAGAGRDHPLMDEAAASRPARAAQ